MFTTRDPNELIGAAMRVLEGNPTFTEELQFNIDAAIECKDQVKIYQLVPQIAQLPITELAVIRARLQAAFRKDWRNRDFDRAIKESQAREKKRARGPLPEVFVSNRPTRDVSRDALAALNRANDPPTLFIRSGQMVYVDVDEKHRPAIKAVTESHLRGRLDRSANYMKITADGEKYVCPPMEVVRDIKEALLAADWGLPALETVVEVPTLRPDGTVLDRPGYDPQSRMFYAPADGLSVPPVPEYPTADDVDAAKSIVDDAFDEFPYADEASKANLYGLLLTPIIRPIIKAPTPIGLIDAPRAGTGKSLLADAFSIVTLGRNCPMTPYPKNEEEMVKQIGSSLIAGRQVVCFDNLEGVLQSPSLALVLTATEYEFRILGASQNITVANNATWIVTGNNIRPSGDMPRRCFHIRMDAKLSNPFQGRKFRHDNLKQWVTDNRGELLHALLVMARYWFVGGQKNFVQKPLGSFEAWHRTVGSILEYAGVKGFLGNLEEFLEEADEAANQWENFLIVIANHYPRGREFRVAELVERISTSEPLRIAVPDSLVDDKTKSADAYRKRLGQALSKRRDQRFGRSGIYLQKGRGNSDVKVATWRVIQPSIDDGAEPVQDDCLPFSDSQ